MVITLDGPTASGKSTLAARLAQHLGWYHVNSGFLYRSIAYALDKQLIPYSDAASLAQNLFVDPRFIYAYDRDHGVRIYWDGEEITAYLKTSAQDMKASEISRDRDVREAVTNYQRFLSLNHNIIVDGRDCGTVVFPRAECKLFVTASLEERARRWCAYQAERRAHYTLQECRELIEKRDERDKNRTISPLKVADDAFVLDTTQLSPDETLQKALTHVQFCGIGF